MISKQEVDTQANRIREWFINEGIYKDKLNDDNANHHFIVEFPMGSGQITDIVFPKMREDMVILGSGLQLSPEHHSGLSSLPKSKYEELMWEIKFKLLSMRPGFILTPPDNIPNLVQFQRPLFFDGLTKNMLMDALQDVSASKLYFIWKMHQMFGTSPPKMTEPMFR